jgi:outer membrane protein TolC
LNCLLRSWAFCAGLLAYGQSVATRPGAQSEPQRPRQAPARIPEGPGLGLSQDAFSGSVSSGPATGGELPLSLRDAIARGLKFNLGLTLGEQETRIARANSLRTLSTLLPSLNLGVNESSQQLNLKAFGFSGFSGLPSVVGPFPVFDARAFLAAPVVDISAWRNERAQRENERAAQFIYRDARDVVVLTVTNLYLLAVTGGARIDTARAQLTTAEALYTQAMDLKNAGVAAGIDVIRADVERQAQQQRVIYFQNEWEKSKLRLGRAIGLPSEQRMRLSDAIPFRTAPAMTPEEAMQKAYGARWDYQAALSAVRGAELARTAAAAQRYPAVDANVNYGIIGPSVTDSHGTFTAAAALRFPVFTGGRIQADLAAAEAVVAQHRAQAEDLRGRIAYEVRSSLLDVNAAGDQVKVAAAALDLANQQLTQARDRFAAGVANSLEVVQAQESVAAANDNYIAGLYSYNSAKASLARTLGMGDETAKELLGAP